MTFFLFNVFGQIFAEVTLTIVLEDLPVSTVIKAVRSDNYK